MRFFTAFILLIAAISANASWAPAGPSLTVAGPWGAWGAHGAWAGDHWGSAWGGSYAPWGTWGAPAAVIAAHAPAIIAAPAHSASYVAANRGSAHSAPLPGHAVSVKSLNLAPAPGTW